MHKIVAAGATALMLVVGTSAYAQERPGGPEFGRRQQFAPEDRAAFLNARVAALHSGLGLTPEQEKLWPVLEQAYRDLDATRGNRAFGRRAEQTADPVQRAQRRADRLAARSVALRRYADVLAPLYQSFDEAQKRRFDILSRVERPPPFGLFRGGEDRGGFRREFRFRRGELRVPDRPPPTVP
jgi:LTXXQ motif family protein